MVKLDLKTESGRQAAWKLVESCDVVVENFSNGVMDALGLGAAKVRAANPRCIYLSLPGFASSDEDPAVKGLKAFEAVILAHVGVFADMGLNRTLMGINPSYSPLPLVRACVCVCGGRVAIERVLLCLREKVFSFFVYTFCVPQIFSP